MQQVLRLHAKSDDFASTVARARQFQDAQDLTKTKKPNIRRVEIHLKPMLAMPVSNQFWMGFRKSLKPSWINKTNLLFVMLDQIPSQKRKTEIVGLIPPDRSHPHRPTPLKVRMVLMPIEKPFVFLIKRRRTEIRLVHRVGTGQMKTYLF